MIKLLNCDCQDYMKGQPNKVFDLAMVDPPYGIGEDGGKNRRGASKHIKKGWDKTIPSSEYFQELFRVSKNQIIWGANHFMQNVGLGSPCWIVWDKLNGTSDFADCELAYTSFKTAVRKFSFRWNGMIQGDMKNKETRIHPTQKPVALYRWIFNNYAKPGQRIFDSHFGSGSSAIAAHYFGLDYVGCEIDRYYFKAAKKRFDQETRQISLFS